MRMRREGGEGRERCGWESGTHHVENNILAVGLLHETAEGSRERDRVEHTGVGDDADHREERALACTSHAAVGGPYLVREKDWQGAL